MHYCIIINIIYGQSELSGMLQNQLAGGKLAEIARMSGAQNLMQFGQDIKNAAKGTPVEGLVGLLGAGETDKVSILVANPNEYSVDVNIFVINGYVGNSIVSDYKAI